MELHERIALVRKAAGLTQEQLGELVGVTRQAVSKWESGQAIPDAITIARLCDTLHVSADYVLLGKEPDDTPDAESAPEHQPPDHCGVCGRPMEGSFCTVCGYTPPAVPPRGPRYAVVATGSWTSTSSEQEKAIKPLVKYCSFTEDYARACCEQMKNYDVNILLRRGLDDHAARWLVSKLDRSFFHPKLVVDNGEEDDALLLKEKAMELPPPPEGSERPGLGFGGTVLAVVVGVVAALFLLSVF